MQNFEMVAKTLAGLEQVLAAELRDLGALNVQPGKRMVSFEGDLQMLYKANLCCRTALRVLKPFYKFTASTTDELYEQAKAFDWSTILTPESTFCIDSVVHSEDFTHSHFVTYRIKDAIVDWFRDRYGDKRPGVRLADADVMINVHISHGDVTLSLDSSGESLHKRGYRVAQTEAPINEVLAAGIILMTGYRGDVPFVDPMCGSGTFLIEAALIAANINPGVFRKSFAFESWPDFDPELFESLYNDDSAEREVTQPIVGADISPEALAIAAANVKSAGVAKYVTLERRPLAHWAEAPQPAGILVTNPPYGKRIKTEDMEGLYETLGNRLKNVFTGYHAWVIGYNYDYFRQIGLAPSQKIDLFNGQLECQLREFVLFEGTAKDFRSQGGKIKPDDPADDQPDRPSDRPRDRRPDRRDRRDSRPDHRDAREGRPDRPDRRPEAGSSSRRQCSALSAPGLQGPRSEDRSDSPRDGRFDRRNPENRFTRRDNRPDRPEGPSEAGSSPRRQCSALSAPGLQGPRDGRRFDGPRDGRRFDDRRFDDRRDAAPKPESENPLAARRNPVLLRFLTNKQPSLPSESEQTIDNVVMRKRGWRKKPEE